jgi:ABC-2 type transport system permease protein
MKNSIIQQMEYRNNFFMSIGVECIFLASKLIYVIIIYNVNEKINGLTADQIIFFIGSYLILTAIYTGFFLDNFLAIPILIRNGDFDMLITKPISLQFIATLRKINFFLPLPNIIAGIMIVCISWRKLNISVDFRTIILYVCITACCGILTYSIFLIPQLLSFWIIKTDSINEITDRLWEFNNMPMLIYSKWIQKIGVFVIPIFVITNFPVMYILEIMPMSYIIWASLAPIIFLFLVRILWQIGIKNYNSASS